MSDNPAQQQPSSVEDPIYTAIKEMVTSKGTIAVGDLLIVPDWSPKQVTDALSRLLREGVVTQSGNYYSLTAQAARDAGKWGRALS